MLIDLLNPSNYVSYNIKIANILGLTAAVYISELLSINDKARKKDKLDNNYFVVDRAYITSRTTIVESEQMAIEDNLKKLGILEKSAEVKNSVSLNITTLTTLLMSPDEKLVDNVKALTKIRDSKVRGTKREVIFDNLKQYVTCENEELREAYYGWIDGVQANPQGFLSKRAVEIFQKTVDEFANHDLDKALQVIDIAAINGYRDATWAINTYNSNYKYNYKVPINVSKTSTKSAIHISDEVF